MLNTDELAIDVMDMLQANEQETAVKLKMRLAKIVAKNRCTQNSSCRYYIGSCFEVDRG